MAAPGSPSLDLPPSYDSLFGRTDFGLTFIDFLPRVCEPGGFFTSAKYETFRTLVDRANEWLRCNRQWKVTTCESVEFKARGSHFDSSKMTYVEYGEGITSYVRGLRLWLTEKRVGSEQEQQQQIGYVNLIPGKLGEDGFFSTAPFETLDSVIQRFNHHALDSSPLPGRVITVESQEMKLSRSRDFDPDRSHWSERGNISERFVFVVRIFFEMMAGSPEEIGLKDFVPDAVASGGIFSLPDYEPFSNVVRKASSWCSQQAGLRFCNAQSLEIKLKRGKHLDTQKMDYMEHGKTSTYYVRILRVAYTRPPAAAHWSVGDPPSVSQLTCRTFVPVQLTASLFLPEYENLLQTRERVTAWVRATGARVIGAETAALRMMSGGERKHGTEATFTYNVSERSEYWIFVVRLYLNGAYREPPPEMLPPVPEIQAGCCAIL